MVVGSGGAKMMHVRPITALRAQGTPSGCRWTPPPTARRTGHRVGGLSVPEEEAAHGPSHGRRRSFVRLQLGTWLSLSKKTKDLGGQQQRIASWGALGHEKCTHPLKRESVVNLGHAFDVASRAYASVKRIRFRNSRVKMSNDELTWWSSSQKDDAEKTIGTKCPELARGPAAFEQQTGVWF